MLDEGVWIQGADRKFYWANETLLQVTGYSLAELRGLETAALINESWIDYVKYRNRLILDGHLAGGYYFPAVKKDGSVIKVKGRIARFGPGFIGIFTVPIAIDPETDFESGLLDEFTYYRQLRQKIEAAYKFNRRFLLMHIGIDDYVALIKASEIVDFTLYFKSMGDKIKALAKNADLCARVADRYFNIVLPMSNNRTAMRQAASIEAELTAYSSELSVSLYNLDFKLSVACLAYDPETYHDEFRIFINRGFKEVAKIEQAKTQ